MYAERRSSLSITQAEGEAGREAAQVRREAAAGTPQEAGTGHCAGGTGPAGCQVTSQEAQENPVPGFPPHPSITCLDRHPTTSQAWQLWLLGQVPPPSPGGGGGMLACRFPPLKFL